MIKNSTYLVPIALLIAAFMYAAPDAQVPATGTIAFTGARIVDGTGRAPIENGTIVVTNGRITNVGAGVKAPAGAAVVNLAGKTVMPGLVNAHGHVNINPTSRICRRKISSRSA
jgi:imidazolonepropionase-like amidohydrolase